MLLGKLLPEFDSSLFLKLNSEHHYINMIPTVLGLYFSLDLIDSYNIRKN